MAKRHPTLVQLIKQLLERLELSQKDAAAQIGISHTTFTKFLNGQEVGQATMQKIRSFSENPHSSPATKQAKGKRKSKGSEISLDDLRFMQNLKPDDLKFIVGIMEATGQTSLNREQMTNLVSLRK